MRRQAIIVLSAATVIAGAGAPVVSAASITPGQYLLHNHPEGRAQPPKYGLRLDELFDVNVGKKDIFTFNFDRKKAEVLLDYDGTSIHIHGRAFGGLVKDGKYQKGSRSWVEIDMRYELTSLVPGDDDIWVDETRNASDSGTLTWLKTGQVFELTNKTKPSAGHSFRFGDETDERGHRGADGLAGWGWLLVDGEAPGTQDFKFGATAIPLPAPALIGLCGLTAVIAGKRLRRSRADAS